MKHWKYLKYILRHKWFVYQAGRKVGASFWRLLVHDFSKFRPSEWCAYVEYFYGGPHQPWAEVPGFAKYECFNAAWKYSKEQVQFRFDVAWLHHQHRNLHHWQYWTLHEDSGATKLLPMPEQYVREMVADWAGAGRAITGKWEVREWYEKNKGKIQLAEETRKLTEQLLVSSF